MIITDVRSRMVKKEDSKLKAVASITIDDCFVIHDIKIIEGMEGPFVAMPNRKTSEGEYKDIAHPIQTDTREMLVARILNAYNEKTKNGGLSAEDTARILNAMGTLLIVIGIDQDRGASDLLDAMGSIGVEEEGLTMVGQNEDITYYAITASDVYKDFVDKIPSEYAEEYLALQTSLIDVLKNAEYFSPHSGSADLLGTILQFETSDLDGNVVKSEELFAAHELTMI
ncbi:MAG: septation regulator SpoVG, partial [Clostridia bacterium]|nr:septation regulator SpoVG [Clostridia bacterium]